MEQAWSWFKLNVLQWIYPPKPIEVIDIIQILLIAFCVYQLILWFKNTRSYALLKGIVFIIAFVIVANIFHMDTIMWLIHNLSVVAITALIIIFQPELRKVLERMGHNNILTKLFNVGKYSGDYPKLFTDASLNEIIRAVYEMAELKVGALIVIEKNLRLDEYIQTGIMMDAMISSQLLTNVFEYNTPLHDGAVIIREDRIVAATCYLPLSDNMDINKKLGTRHRAGLGITEISDCFTIIVSEETGKVSYAHEGRLVTGVVLSDLREKMHQIQRIGTSENSLFTRREDD